jgi:hypothetical protein
MGRRGKNTEFWCGNLKNGGRVEDRGADWRINIEMDLKEIGWESLDWIDVAEDRDKWR